MVEQAAVNRKVEGSSPSLGANFFQLFQEFIDYLPEWRNWQTHRT